MDISVLKAELSAIQLKASALGDKIKANTITDGESAELESMADRAVALKAQITHLEKNPSGSPLGDTAGDYGWDEGLNGQKPTGTPAGEKGFITPASVKRMAAAQVAQIEAKGLVANGSNVIPVEFDKTPQVLATPGANLGILDVLAVKTRGSSKYTYVRQSVRTNNAAVVPAGSLKPTSVFTVEEVEGELDVVAHMSEYVGTYLLKDNDALESFLVSELRAGILAKVAELAVAEFASVTGSQTQAFVDNAMDSIYLAASKAAALGYNPDVVLLPRATFDAIMLAKDADGNYLYRKSEDSRINGLHPVIIEGAADQAIVLDSSKVGISVDKQGVETKWDSISRFEYNELRALVEGRFAIDVFAAPAIVVVETAGE
ncbi:phage major capsid protein [Microbacterium arabinogalactanolyticum]|uniref:phage major capsid protein n=1 Tax=Microbacterium arabinogalactanolyticum TaxID=69365 RepID=UPI002557ADA7|nr:phage major capsid protein [Microbacterium arabinogalactanolyticum]